MLNLIYSSLLSVLLLSTSFAGEAMNSAQENKKESNYYISVSHGKSLYDISDRLFDVLNSHSSDKQDKSTKITFGKVISDNYSFELSYMNAGQANLQTLVGSVTNTGTQRTSTIDLNLVYKFASIYDTDLYFKAGPSYVMTKTHSIRNPEAGFTKTKEVMNNKETSLHTGFGIMKNIIGYTIIVEYDKYHSLNSGGDFMILDTGAPGAATKGLQGDLETLTVGLKFNF
jgi:hypothetical protein